MQVLTGVGESLQQIYPYTSKADIMTKRIHIILPNRIGDSILSLPSLLCLKQLMRTYQPGALDVTVFTHFPLQGLFGALDLFEFRMFNVPAKLGALLNPPDEAFFLSTTSKNIGYRAKTRYGLRLSNKKLVRYDVDLPFLEAYRLESLPAELLTFLKDTCALPPYAIRRFGILLEMGFTVEQIMHTFVFDHASLTVSGNYFDVERFVASEYVVFCMEAAYNRVHAEDRRWNTDDFLALAEKLHKDHGIKSVFIGLQDRPVIEGRAYMMDLRNKLTLDQIARVLYYSRGYIGNDTGPLHLANLLRKKSIGFYTSEAAINYRPLFPEYNRAYLNMQKYEEVCPHLGEFLEEPTWPSGEHKPGSSTVSI